MSSSHQNTREKGEQYRVNMIWRIGYRAICGKIYPKKLGEAHEKLDFHCIFFTAMLIKM
jgi:hypothetical protein